MNNLFRFTFVSRLTLFSCTNLILNLSHLHFTLSLKGKTLIIRAFSPLRHVASNFPERLDLHFLLFLGRGRTAILLYGGISLIFLSFVAILFLFVRLNFSVLILAFDDNHAFVQAINS